VLSPVTRNPMRVTGRSVDFTYVDLRGYQGEPAEPTS
jgi:hypothetical protein